VDTKRQGFMRTHGDELLRPLEFRGRAPRREAEPEAEHIARDLQAERARARSASEYASFFRDLNEPPERATRLATAH
jgi:hypothetical protein